MRVFLIEGGNYGLAILIGLLIFFGVPIILGVIALLLRNKKPKTAKVLGIITALYLITSLGYCGVLVL